MRTIERTNAFKRDYKREQRANRRNLAKSLPAVLELLLSDQSLPPKFNDHPLSGEWKGYRDCHVAPDLVLIYHRTEDVLRLVRLGSHSELFD
jgi:mRNA interferase YafQ